MNLKIKFRESFRPFAPSVLRERASECFAMEPDQDSPYMLLVFDVLSEQADGSAGGVARGDLQEAASGGGLERVHEARGRFPAITHVDYSARVQTVDAERFPRYYRLLKAFESRTGCPMLINTSFNVRGEPIVCTAADAYRCFMATNMDALVVDRFVMRKEAQPNARRIDSDAHLSQFALD